MNSKDLIDSLKDIISCYEKCQLDGSTNKEIMMWRLRFLREKGIHTSWLIEKCDENIFVFNCFLSIPSEKMIEKDVEVILKDLHKHYEDYPD